MDEPERDSTHAVMQKEIHENILIQNHKPKRVFTCCKDLLLPHESPQISHLKLTTGEMGPLPSPESEDKDPSRLILLIIPLLYTTGYPRGCTGRPYKGVGWGT